jgi:hypothetical protein
VDEINTGVLTSYPNPATIVRSVLPTSTSEKIYLILRLVRSVPISKMHYFPVDIGFRLPVHCSLPVLAIIEIGLYILNRRISQIHRTKFCEHGNEHPAHIIWT